MGFVPIRELFPAPMPPFRTKPGPKRAEPAPAPAPKPAAPPVAAQAPAAQASQCNC